MSHHNSDPTYAWACRYDDFSFGCHRSRNSTSWSNKRSGQCFLWRCNRNTILRQSSIQHLKRYKRNCNRSTRRSLALRQRDQRSNYTSVVESLTCWNSHSDSQCESFKLSINHISPLDFYDYDSKVRGDLCLSSLEFRLR